MKFPHHANGPIPSLGKSFYSDLTLTECDGLTCPREIHFAYSCRSAVGEVPVSAQSSLVREAWIADRKRYPRFALLLERSIWAVGVLRFGQWVDALGNPAARLAGRVAYQFMATISEMTTGISIPKSAKIGPGLRIFHTGGVVVHELAEIGANCTIRHGVTIGMRSYRGGVPTIGDNVDIGACAMILGDITIGDNAKIGAGAMVQVSMPEGATAYAPRAVISIPDTGEVACAPTAPSTRSVPMDWPAPTFRTVDDAAAN
jgi:serine O-acetyltransferase